MTRPLILMIALIVSLAAPAWAGLDEGVATIVRGDYEAVVIWSGVLVVTRT